MCSNIWEYCVNVIVVIKNKTELMTIQLQDCIYISTRFYFKKLLLSGLCIHGIKTT